MIFFPLLLAAAANASLLESTPKKALLNETVELRPIGGHHFNMDAPQKCDGRPALDASPKRIRCQMTHGGDVPIVVYVCDDAQTFCRDERFSISVTGPRTPAANNAAMKPARRAAAEGFIDNRFEQAAELSKKSGKPLFIDFYGSWCPPCNDLDELAYPTREFKDAAQNFVLLGIDVDTPESVALKNSFHVGGYPTLIVADDRSREIARAVGYRSGPALAKFMRDALAHAGDPVENADARARNKKESNADRLRAAQWRLDRGEFKSALELIGNAKSPELLKLKWTTAREAARDARDDAAGEAALIQLLRAYPDAVEFSDWASDLAETDADKAREFETALKKSTAHWEAAPALGETGYEIADLKENLADYFEQIGSTAAARAEWSDVADECARQAALSPLKLPRGPNMVRSHALLSAGRAAEAKNLLKDLVATYPQEFTFNYRYASALSKLGDDKAAYEFARKAVTAGYGDNRLTAVRLQAQIEHKLGKDADARRTLDDALAETSIPPAKFVRTSRFVQDLRRLRESLNDPSAAKE